MSPAAAISSSCRVRVARLGEPRSVAHRAAGAHRRERAHRRDGEVPVHAEEHRVGGLGQRVERREARHAGDLGARGVHRPDRPGEPESQALPDHTLGGCATDDSDRSRSEQAAQIGHGGDIS